MEGTKAAKKKFVVPHILVLISALILLFSALSYIIPGGEYQMNEAGRAIAGTFAYTEKNPISPWQALLSVQQGVIDSGSTIALLLICGGAIAVVLATGCFEKVMNYSIYKLQDRSVIILIPSIITMMSLLGAFAGNDSMIAFVSVGLIICPKLGLDRICAMAMFYLGYLIGQGASITSNMLITIQSLCDVVPLSGMPVRIGIWVIFTAINAAYCTRYALKIVKDPSRSITGVMTPAAGEGEIKKEELPMRAVLCILCLFGCYVLFAVGTQKWGWKNNYLAAIMVVNVFLTSIIYKMDPNVAGRTFMKGAQGMGGICLVLGFAKVIGTILNKSKMVNTIAEGASHLFGGFGLIGAVLCIFVFILLFNMLIPSGLSKAAILLPLVCPIGDVLGITRDVVALTYSLGDSLTNTLTPLSSPLVGALGLADVNYTDWLKYAIPLMGILATVAAVILAFLAGISWVG